MQTSLRVRNSTWDFFLGGGGGAVMFGPGIFLGCVGSPRDFFGS